MNALVNDMSLLIVSLGMSTSVLLLLCKLNEFFVYLMIVDC